MQGTVLVDGFVRAMWEPKTAGGTTHLLISPFARPMPKSDQAAVIDEGRRLLEFLAPDHKHDVRIGAIRP
jgi:Winged helix DNA-binding domain